MKVAIVFASNLWFAPYIQNYTKLLDKWGINYELIYWDRFLEEPNKPNVFSCIPSKGKISKYVDYYRFSQFVKNRIISEKFDKVIMSGPQTALLLRSFLTKTFKGKYILDYRDLSIEQIPIMKWRYKALLKNSYANVISSPGFADYLPQGYKFLISHNFDIDLVKKALTTTVQPFSIEPIRILTIGGIRDYSSNSEEIIALSNVENVKMDFVGKGPSKETLEKLANEIGTKNITFTGYYEKKDEVDIVLKSSFMNIYYPKIKSHSSALSNRFYNSLMYCRPMIVTKGGVQGNYAEKYHVGISIDSADQILGEIKKWIETVNFVEYQENCKKLLEEFLNDYESFKESVYNFILG